MCEEKTEQEPEKEITVGQHRAIEQIIDDWAKEFGHDIMQASDAVHQLGLKKEILKARIRDLNF